MKSKYAIKSVNSWFSEYANGNPDAFSTNSIKNPPTCFDERISLMLKETALI
jgi:hypothetical protein